MTRAHKVLFCGTSTLTYYDEDPSDSLIGLAEAHLREGAPEIEWSCEAEVVYMTRGMLRRTLAAVERLNPDTVVLRLSSVTFVDETIANRIRERWPRLYRPLRRVSEWLRDLTKGGRYGKDSQLGEWFYRIPRQLAVRVIGTAPEIRVEDALAVSKETIDALLRKETHNLIVGLVPYGEGDNITPEEASRRGSFLNEQLRAFLEERRVAYYDPMARNDDTVFRQRTPDQWHPQIGPRKADAIDAAGLVLTAVVGERDAAGAEAAQ